MLSRVWIALFVYLGHSRHPYLADVPGGWKGVANWWLNPWTTYDSQWFLGIAQNGYEPATAPFFPLYPLLLRLAGTNEVVMALWGVALSNVAFLAGLALLWHLTRLDYDEQTATHAVWLLSFYPLSCVFSAVYTESVFLFFLVAAFLCARRRLWIRAGILAMLASLTRNSGLIIFVALCFEYSRSVRSAYCAAPSASAPLANVHPPKRTWNVARWGELIAIALPLLGFLAVQGYLANRFGGVLSGVTSHEDYGRHLTWPWMPIVRDLASILALRVYDVTTVLNVAVTIAVFVLVILRWRRQPLSYSVLMLGIMLMHLTYGRVSPPYTNSSLRFMATTFPFVQLLAIYAAPATGNRFRLFLHAALCLVLCAILSYLFGLKQFVTG